MSPFTDFGLISFSPSGSPTFDQSQQAVTVEAIYSTCVSFPVSAVKVKELSKHERRELITWSSVYCIGRDEVLGSILVVDTSVSDVMALLHLFAHPTNFTTSQLFLKSQKISELRSHHDVSGQRLPLHKSRFGPRLVTITAGFQPRGMVSHQLTVTGNWPRIVA